VFAADVEHSVAITEEFEKQGYHARSITNNTNAKHRAQLLQDFRDGKFPILVNCEMMTEGAGKAITSLSFLL
jgi:ATP-dependent helicase IRC3